jgi:hypothetical protein
VNSTAVPQKFVIDTVSRTHRIAAHTELFGIHEPWAGVGPTLWVITLTDRAAEQVVSEPRAFNGPFSQAHEDALVEWLRQQQRSLGLPDDGDWFAMLLRHDIYALIGMCRVQRPDLQP